MNIMNISQNHLQSHYNSKNQIRRNTFKSNGEIIYEDDYVKIPKKKYQRNKIILYIVNSILTIEIARDLYNIFKNHGKPPFP